ncbi:MAG: 50S ribosomal protein L25, partial [Bacteroidia bacterium]|nr:50S ribosomal protein L25 [Bacteroidia bacterium]
MQLVKIEGTKREEIAKAAVKAVRNEGKVPCVLYGGDEVVHFAVNALDFNKLLFTANTYIIELEIAGKSYKAIMKEKQFHPVTDKLVHVDFLQIHDNAPIIVPIPVKLVGAAEGVKQGGRLVTKLRKVNLKGFPAAIPDSVEVNIGPLDIGDSIRVRDINIDGVELTDQPSNVIVGVRVTRKV